MLDSETRTYNHSIKKSGDCDVPKRDLSDEINELYSHLGHYSASELKEILNEVRNRRLDFLHQEKERYNDDVNRLNSEISILQK